MYSSIKIFLKTNILKYLTEKYINAFTPIKK